MRFSSRARPPASGRRADGPSKNRNNQGDTARQSRSRGSRARGSSPDCRAAGVAGFGQTAATPWDKWHYHSKMVATRRLVAHFKQEYPSAMACFEEDFEACIAQLHCPPGRRRVIRMTNLLKRLFREERRWVNAAGTLFGERGAEAHARRARPCLRSVARDPYQSVRTSPAREVARDMRRRSRVKQPRLPFPARLSQALRWRGRLGVSLCCPSIASLQETSKSLIYKS